MSEHTPLTEAERTEVAHAIWFGAEDGPIAADGELAATIERIIAARTSTATADTEGCWQPCDPDCEVGSVHCEAVHLPSHKAKTVLHAAECVATADDGLRERVEAELNAIWRESQAGHMIIKEAGIMQDIVLRLRELLDATAAPTTDTGARDE